jgi:predicted TIM-barrel fold metal-dependent hydrolase
MKSRQEGWRRVGWVVLLLALPAAGLAQAIQHEPAPDAANKKKDLLLRDFKPRSMLKVPVHLVERSRFPAIDFHNHINDARGTAEQVPPAQVVQIMDRCNLARLVILTGRWGDALQKVVDEMVKPYPERFTVFTEVDWKRIDEPAFGETMARQIEDAVRRGARGLKITKDLGLENKDKTGALIAVDDPRADPIWAACGRLGIPVAMHVSDPDAFFEPIDPTNERWEELAEFPSWSFYGPQFPKKASILEARNRVFARHPSTTFVSLHFGDQGEDLGALAEVLDRHPNVLVEMGARANELGRQPRRAREFFLKYQDRILFGTDAQPSEAMYRNWFRWLETADEYFDYWGSPGQGRWEIYGLDLPGPVLEKVYRRNAERLLSLKSGRRP